MERIGTENIHMTKGHYFPSKQLGQYLGFSQMGILVSQNLHIITEDLLFTCQWLFPAWNLLADKYALPRILSFEFNWLGFNAKLKNKFYFEGGLVDVDIPIKSMEDFIKESKEDLEKLAIEHSKRIKSV